MHEIHGNSLGITSAQVRELLARQRNPNIRKRLLGVAALLDGKNLEAAAKAAGVYPKSVERWAGWVKEHGLERLCTPSAVASKALKFDPVKLRTKAAHEKDRRLAARLLALAQLAEGYSSLEVSQRADVHRMTILGWAREYKKHGVEALRNKPIPGAKKKLNSKNEAEFVRLVERGRGPNKGAWTSGTLKKAIFERFGVVYTENGVQTMLERLGFRYLKDGWVRVALPEKGNSARGSTKTYKVK